ncbi:MAG: bifunctional oligoribonuclease/PAP phosphatase NrnA [Bacteroidota bacterium]
MKKLLEEKSEVLITTHYNPDGDAIGSSLALFHFLTLLGINSKVLLPNELPSFLLWMPGADQAVIYSDDTVLGNSLIASSDLVFCMDYNALSRVKLFSDQLRASMATRVIIDHHIQPENEFDLTFSDTRVSSTSELLYQIIDMAGHAERISKEMAECLFVGMMTDTGSFSYACNRPETFEIAANLIRAGMDVERVHRMVYDTYSESRMRLLGHCLGANMKVMPEFATAYIWLSKEDMEEYNYQQGDTEGVVNYALSIQNVAVAALFTERGDRIRVSLRSKGTFSVNEFARSHFNGGGHRNAAGGDIFKTMPDTLAWFEALLPQYSDEIHQSLAYYK